MTPGAGDVSRFPPLIFATSDNISGLSFAPSGNPSHASPETLSGVCRHDLNHDNRNHSALQSASREPENRAEKRGDSHRFWFFGEELFFAEKWGVVGGFGLAPR